MTTDTKIVDRIKKLLALAASGSGATEAEASTAAAKAAEIMEEYGLTTMAVEMSGGVGESRGRDGVKVDAPAWYRGIMEALAESFFCHVDLVKTGKRQFEFRLIGRMSSVTSARLTFEYLSAAVWRLSRQVKDGGSPHYFRCGCAERIAERIRDRHVARLKAQKEEAEARTASGQTNGALVVTLVDLEHRERCLNEDFRRGLKPGTTEERINKSRADTAVKEARVAELVAQGIAHGVAWNMVWFNWDRAKAEEYEAAYLKAQAKARARSDRWTKSDQQKWESYQRQQNKRSHPSWMSGRQVGDKVSLDQQIDRNIRGSLT